MSAFGCRLMIASRIVPCRNDRPLINRLDSAALLSVGLVFVFVITDVVCEPACMAKLPTALAGKEVVAISQPTNQQSINSLICGSPRIAQ